MDYGYNSERFERELRSDIKKRLADTIDQIAHERGVEDWASYRNLCGYVAAFGEVLQMADELRERLLKKPD